MIYRITCKESEAITTGKDYYFKNGKVVKTSSFKWNFPKEFFKTKR